MSRKKQNLSLMHNDDGYDEADPYAKDDFQLEGTHNAYLEGLASELSSILGLNSLETRVYLNLLRMGPITASALSKEINIDRTKIYRLVDRLSNTGIVAITFSSPKLCIAADPNEILSLTLRKKEEEVTRIKNDGKTLVEKIKQVTANKNKLDVPTFRIIQGLDSISSQIELMLEATTDVVYFVTTIEDVSRLYHSEIPEKIKIVEKAGGHVRLIINDVSQQQLPFVKRFGASEVRVGKLPSKGRIVVSKYCPVTGQLLASDSAVRGTLHENVDAECALFTNSEEMTNNLLTLCNFIWKSAETIKL